LAASAACALALVVSLAFAVPASAAPDDLSGGSVSVQLQNGRGLKMKPRDLNLSIISGALDPITGEGSVSVKGKFTVKKGKRKTKVQLISLGFGANGAPGKVVAKVGKKQVGSFGTSSGGTIARDGWGAKLSGVTIKLASKGAKSLNKRLAPRAGKASASASKIKSGQTLGSVSLTTIPRTVEVLPGGSIVLNTDPLLLLKLAAHCIDGTPGGNGAYPVAPATQSLLGAFTFPVTGGAVAPSLNDGRVISAGGQNIAKNNGLLTILYPCMGAPPVGTTVAQDLFQVHFNTNSLAANTVLPAGPLGVATLANLNLNSGNTTLDPDTKQLTITGVPVPLDGLAAFVLNTTFPNVSGSPANDFQAGDLLGTLDVTATLR
jgi:hypothetical protein